MVRLSSLKRVWHSIVLTPVLRCSKQAVRSCAVIRTFFDGLFFTGVTSTAPSTTIWSRTASGSSAQQSSTRPSYCASFLMELQWGQLRNRLAQSNFTSGRFPP